MITTNKSSHAASLFFARGAKLPFVGAGVRGFFFLNPLSVVKILTMLLLILIPYTLSAPFSFASEFNPLVDLSAIAQIESSGNPSAIGDHGKSQGLYQISQPVVSDYNQAHNTSYSIQDCLRQTISQKIASWYLNERIPSLLKHFKQPVTTETVIQAYNCGINCVVKGHLPTITKNYLKKYRRLTHA